MSAQSREHDIKEFVLWCRAGIAGEERLRELLDAAIAEEREANELLRLTLENVLSFMPKDDVYVYGKAAMVTAAMDARKAIRERTR